MLNFTITPAADCLHSGSGSAAGQGLISISLVDGSDVAVDKVMVEPGTWGRELSVVVSLPLRTSRCFAEAPLPLVVQATKACTSERISLRHSWHRE